MHLILEPRTRYFLDTEFIDNGFEEPTQLISISLVSSDDREYYAELSETNLDKAGAWVRENVLPHLTGPRKTREQIKRDLCDFVLREKEGHPEIWAYFGAFDWTLFCSIFGAMVALPRNMPFHYMDLRQLQMHLGVKKSDLPEQTELKHHALHDARWNRRLFELLQKRAEIR